VSGVGDELGADTHTCQRVSLRLRFARRRVRTARGVEHGQRLLDRVLVTLATLLARVCTFCSARRRNKLNHLARSIIERNLRNEATL